MSSACHGRESILHALHRSWRAHMEQPCYSYWMCEGIVSVRLWCGSWSSPSCHMTSARLSLTLLLSLVLALKAAELKRCCGDKQARRREAIMLLLIIILACRWRLQKSLLPFRIWRSCCPWRPCPGWSEVRGQKYLSAENWTVKKTPNVRLIN